ncbi:MAG: hypothetical protein JWN41_402 [Thermoleophilia bacterium]|nr:hypothetical protein [Thermoleophilia bacterium]
MSLVQLRLLGDGVCGIDPDALADALHKMRTKPVPAEHDIADMVTSVDCEKFPPLS